LNIWDILGIAPTDNPREIKRAYAKLLAQYHPEEHPEKFEEIRQAYEIALSYVSAAVRYDADLSEDIGEDQHIILSADVPDNARKLAFECLERTPIEKILFELPENAEEGAFESLEQIFSELFLSQLPDYQYEERSIFLNEFYELDERLAAKEREQEREQEQREVEEADEWARKSVGWGIAEFNKMVRSGFSKSKLMAYLSSSAFEQMKRNPYFAQELLVVLREYAYEWFFFQYKWRMAMILEAFAFDQVPPDEQHLYEALKTWLVRPTVLRKKREIPWRDYLRIAAPFIYLIAVLVFVFMLGALSSMLR